MLYVDDLAIYYSAKEIGDVEEKLQEAINTLLDVTNKYGFRFSIPKTYYVHFCRLRTRHREPVLTLQNHVLEHKLEAKFLGVTFDHKLYWGPHIQDLVVKCSKLINLLKCISSVKWGGDRETLLKFYTTMILAKLDYGCIVYASARKSRLKALDSIQCTGLRLALGAFRTSPLSSLCCEASIPPLQFRRYQFLLAYGSGVWAQPNHPNHNILFDRDLHTLFANRPTISRPANIRLHELLNSMDKRLLNVYNITTSNIPQWKFKTPKIHLECTKYKKNETNKELLRATFYSIMNSYEECHILYTDGPKLEQGVGSAVMDGEESHTWTLPTCASIYTAEIYAILQALKHIEIRAYSNTLICSDSLSSIQSIANTFSTDPLVQTILSRIQILENSGKRVCFVWTPSHINICGNELADRAAKDAANRNPQNITMRVEDIKTHLKKDVLNLWQEEWSNSDAKLKEIKANIQKWKITPSFTRREQSIIVRLRMGHTRLTSSYLLSGNPPPQCESCNVRLTVKHILLNCPTYEQQRLTVHLPNRLSICLGDSVENLRKTINFIKAANLYTKI